MTKENKQRWYFVGGIVLLGLLVFRSVLWPGETLFTTDDNVGALMMRKNLLPYGWWSGWNDAELLGIASPVFISLTNVLLYIFPATFFNNWINAFDLMVGSIFLGLFLRERGLSWLAVSLGALTAYWVGSNMTLVYAGHIGKFGVLLWVSVFLWLTQRALRTRALPYAILAGGALGMMFLEQADVAFFFALALGPYALFAAWRTYGPDYPALLRFAVPLFAVGLLLAVHPLLSGYQTAVEGVAAVEEEDPEARWHFITQWSWPPEESIDFIAPGYTGWRSGEPTGPYTGRMGRSAGWEETGQGFPNFKLENQYIGAIPILFALLALILAWRARDRIGDTRSDILFWGVVTLLALLLSFGKYFPLYALFYQLPFVSSVRNPNKFLQVFQFGLALLSAYGVQAALHREGMSGTASWMRQAGKPLLIAAAVVGGVLLFWGIGSMAAWESLTNTLRSQWGQHAATIAGNRIWAQLHGGIMTLAGAALLYWLMTAHRSRRALQWASIGIVGLVLFDVFFIARQYVTTVTIGEWEDNRVVEIVRSDNGHGRVALVSQENFYNQWLSILFPYHDIKTINVAQMPRMPVDYQQYLGAVANNPIRHWELGAVSHVLGPARIWGQISNEPTLRDRFDLIYAYNVEPVGGGVRVVSASADRRGQHVVLHHTAPRHRYALVSDWQIMDDAEALSHLASPAFVPFERVLVASGQPGLQQLPEPERAGVGGSVRRMAYRPGYVELRVSADAPSILRVADKYDPHWQARVNGKRAEVLRVDYIMQGVLIPAGVHTVTLRYSPGRGSLWVQGLGFMGCVVAGLQLVARHRRSRHEP